MNKGGKTIRFSVMKTPMFDHPNILRNPIWTSRKPCSECAPIRTMNTGFQTMPKHNINDVPSTFEIKQMTVWQSPDNLLVPRTFSSKYQRKIDRSPTYTDVEKSSQDEYKVRNKNRRNQR